MTQGTFDFLLFAIPLLAGGLIAALNADNVNATTERLEAWTRAKQRALSGNKAWFPRYIINPVLWMIVQFSNWTDGFTHRGLKNGVRVTAALYLILFWLFLLYAALIVVIALVIAAVVLHIAFKVLVSSGTTSGSDEPTYRSESASEPARGSRSFRKTGMFTEDETGRTAADGTMYTKTGMFTEDEVGRVSDDGTLYKKTGMFTEDETGRIDDDGKIYKKTGMFTEEEVGRIDKDGTVYKKTGMFTEEETGRVERDE